MWLNPKIWFATAALLVSLSFPVFAWDEIGHKTTAFIAWETMTPAAREEAVRLLLAAPEDSGLSVLYNAFSSRSADSVKRELFMFASTWPDVVRDRGFEVRYKKYHQSNWHYGAIFWEGDGKKLENFPEPSGAAIPKLYEIEKILRDPGYKDDEKAIALAWFLHVAGDIHNPVHNASRVTETEPNGDQGGNLFTLEPAKPDGSRRMNLHSYWDSIIGNYIPRKNDECDQDYLGSIGKKLIRKNPLNRMQDRLMLGQYSEWNEEGFRFLPEIVYGSGLERDKMPSKEYRKQTFKVSREQIALAGYRIGKTLNDIFGKQ